MKPIPLRELRLLGVAKRWQIDYPLSQLDSLQPVKGWVQAQLSGSELQVSGSGSTLVELCCDRCLKTFSYRLKAHAEELIAVGSNLDSGLNAELDGAVESLDPEASFDGDQWLFEQLSLQLPLKRLCDFNCSGIMVNQINHEPKAVDPRWAALGELSEKP